MIKALGYFIEIIRGSLITTRHFSVNLFFHILKVLGIKTKRKGAVTIQYPEQKKEIASTKEKISSEIKRTFFSDEELHVQFEVYNLSLDPKTGVNRFTSEYLFYEGDKLLTRVPASLTEPTSDKDCRIQSSFRLKNFKPGKYKLRVNVVDSISGREQSKDISFSVIQ